ncbi:MAG: acetate kinase [Planctomycetota bacterium]
MKVLVINTGSSSVKFELFDMQSRSSLTEGAAERIGEKASLFSWRSARGDETRSRSTRIANHRAALELVREALSLADAIANEAELGGVGHRVVHGGERFQAPTLIDEQVLQAVREQAPLAPLHNPANLVGIEEAANLFPATPQVAVFDTAFHHTMPPHAYRYALPDELYRRGGVRRYGFHGTSHQYVAKRAAEFLGRSPAECNLIVLHLGNGASAAAIQGGRCIDTSMGMTPLEGLIMGTRCGDVDPGVLLHLARVEGLEAPELDQMVNRQSGLKGICGQNDMREVLRRAQDGDDDAALAAEMYASRIRKYIGAYCAALPSVDAIVFTAGIGENSAAIRHKACQRLNHLGIVIDEQRNAERGSGPRAIHADQSPVGILVIPTDEELEIAEQTLRCVEDARDGSSSQ